MCNEKRCDTLAKFAILERDSNEWKFICPVHSGTITGVGKFYEIMEYFKRAKRRTL